MAKHESLAVLMRRWLGVRPGLWYIADVADKSTGRTLILKLNELSETVVRDKLYAMGFVIADVQGTEPPTPDPALQAERKRVLADVAVLAHRDPDPRTLAARFGDESSAGLREAIGQLLPDGVLG